MRTSLHLRFTFVVLATVIFIFSEAADAGAKTGTVRLYLYQSGTGNEAGGVDDIEEGKKGICYYRSITSQEGLHLAHMCQQQEDERNPDGVLPVEDYDSDVLCERDTEFGFYLRYSPRDDIQDHVVTVCHV